MSRMEGAGANRPWLRRFLDGAAVEMVGPRGAAGRAVLAVAVFSVVAGAGHAASAEQRLPRMTMHHAAHAVAHDARARMQPGSYRSGEWVNPVPDAGWVAPVRADGSGAYRASGAWVAPVPDATGWVPPVAEPPQPSYLFAMEPDGGLVALGGMRM